MVQDYLRFPAFAFDVETVGTRPSRDLPVDKGKKAKDAPALDAMTNRVFWISFAGPGRADVIPLGHTLPGPKQLEPHIAFDILEPLLFSEAVKVGANVKFDVLSVAKYYDFPVAPPYADVQTMVHILDENFIRKGGFNLENLSQKLLGYTYKEKLGEKVAKSTFEQVARYSFLDAKMTWLLYQKLLPLIEKQPAFQFLFDLEMDVIEALVEMYIVGVHVDRNGFLNEYNRLSEQLAVAEAKVYEAAGTTFNPRSAPQRNQFFYDTLGLKCDFFTEKGAQSTNAEALRALAKKSPVAKALLEYTSLVKLVSQYFKGFIPHIQDDDRIRAHYKGTGPVTGRYACSRPNIQNIPIRRQENFDSAVVRRLFTAPPDKGEPYILIVADYSQIELRILAHQCGDPQLVRAYTEGIDLHRLTASMVYQVEFEKVEGWQRSIGKTANFNFAFEGGPARVIEAVEKDGGKISVREAERVYEAWHLAYPRVRKWGDYQKKLAFDRGYVETLFGRRRRLPEIRYRGDSETTRKARNYARRQAVNHPIQGTAGDIAKLATVRLHDALFQTPARFVLQVHDEFMVQAPKRLEAETISLVREAMEGITRNGGPVLVMPLLADIHSGQNWVEAK